MKKLDIKKLKSLIKESFNNFHMSEDDLKSKISNMDANEISSLNYINSETGEIVLSKGEKARTSQFHPQYELDFENNAKQKSSEWETEKAKWYAEDEERAANAESARELTQKKASIAYKNAVKKYADNWSNYTQENSDVDPEDAAPDAADGFFYDNPNWMRWSKILILSRSEIKSYVEDMVYDAMTR